MLAPSPSLPLALPDPLLTGPFTTAHARAVGVARHRLLAMQRAGVVRRLLRGVYVAADRAEDAALRAAALALLVDGAAVAVDRTAAWLHGLDLPGEPVHAHDVLGRSHPGLHFGSRRRLADREVLTLPAGIRVTTPVRTLLDLGRLLAPDRALATLDLALRTGRCRAAGLFAELPAQSGLPGADRLPRLVASADARAADVAESLLRHCWYDAALPPPVPGLVLRGQRLALALPTHRFGVVLARGCASSAETAARATTSALDRHPVGWTVAAVPAWRVLHGDPELVAERLRSAFGAHLLGVRRSHDAGADALG